MGTVNKTYKIHAPANAVFEALTNPEIIAKWSGSEAIMENRQDGKFSLWDGTIHGINRKINANEIKQDWKEEAWEEFSQVTFRLNIIDEGSAELTLLHENIPQNSVNSINSGWDTYYLGPLKDLLES